MQGIKQALWESRNQILRVLYSKRVVNITKNHGTWIGLTPLGLVLFEVSSTIPPLRNPNLA